MDSGLCSPYRSASQGTAEQRMDLGSGDVETNQHKNVSSGFMDLVQWRKPEGACPVQRLKREPTGAETAS